MRCQRCHEETSITTCSWFNTQEICMDCSEKEEKDPRYSEAKKAEAEACRQGNYNFRGIGR